VFPEGVVGKSIGHLRMRVYWVLIIIRFMSHDFCEGFSTCLA